MIKSTISLKNGTVVTVEVESVNDLAVLLSKMNNGIINSGTTSSLYPVKQQVLLPKRSPRPFSKHDVLEATRIIKDNINLERGLSSLVFAYLKKNGDNRHRTPGTIHALTSDIKGFLTGKGKKPLGKKIKKAILESQMTHGMQEMSMPASPELKGSAFGRILREA